jgi:hypothetical protein
VPPPDSETTAVLKNYQALVKPDSQSNRFVAHFYNEFTADIPQDFKKQMQNGIPREITSLDKDN